MNHISREHWQKYINNKLDEVTRNQYESHLYSCDQCMDLYLELIESSSPQMPKISDEIDFTDTIMKSITKQSNPIKEEGHDKKILSIQNKKVQQKTMIHYILAAAMTLLLMSTGVFSQLMGVVNQFESANAQEETSIVMQLMNKPSSITTIIENNNQEGNHR